MFLDVFLDIVFLFIFFICCVRIFIGHGEGHGIDENYE